MIKTQKQYEISKKKINALNVQIHRILKHPQKIPLRKEILITSLEISRNEIEEEILGYEIPAHRKPWNNG